ncbi:MAG: hypothetical protein A2413_11290 [Treponema sp. RIFOXYC1_FULL_61_9]|nr:MAG: hypothetical protein A2413_11290 [Treponema sp. RIFOXYC1_FULL_61_9]
MFIAAAFLVPACQMGIGGNPKMQMGQTGSLTVNVSAIAPWLKAGADRASRAYLYATSVKVSVRNSNGTNIISPVTLSTNLIPSSGTGSSTLQAIDNIPIGSDYQVTVEIFNSNFSSSASSIGSKSQVSIADGQTTTVDVVCVPNLDNLITVNVANNPILDAFDEVWYSFYAIGGQAYTVHAPLPAAHLILFDAAGNFVQDVSSADAEFTPESDVWFYLGVASDAVAVTPSILVSAIFPIASEGSLLEPVSLVPGTDHAFKAGITANGDSVSYYSFSTAEAGAHFLVFDGYHYLDWSLYSDPAFQTVVGGATYTQGDCELGSLQAGSSYYLKITNRSSSNMDAPGRVVSPSAAAASMYGEGSAAIPASIVIGTAENATLGSRPWNENSYYSFTTGESALLHSISVGSFSSELEQIECYLGIDSTFYSYTTSKSSMGSSSISFGVLSPNTTYYLMIKDASTSSDFHHSFSFTITSSAPDYISLPLGTSEAATSYTNGTLTSSVQELWYEVILPNTDGGTFHIYWDDVLDGSGTYSLDIAVSALSGGLVHYFNRRDSGYVTASTILVPAGDDRVYLRVQPWFSAGTGTFGVKIVNPSYGSLVVNAF